MNYPDRFVNPRDGIGPSVILVSGARNRTVFMGTICLLLLLLGGLIHPVYPQMIQRLEIPSSPNPVGSGARALGMGGAFIAVADDATAASWNPGGLVQLETPEASVVGAGFYRNEDNSFSLHPEASGDQSVSDVSLNYLSASYPFTLLDRNMVVSINYQNLYDLSREWRFPLNEKEFILSKNGNMDYTQKGSLSALGLAYAIQISPEFSFGFTLNFWTDSFSKNQWEQKIHQWGEGSLGTNPFTYESNSRDKYSFSGFNANLGLMWNVTSQWTLGVVFKTPFTASLKHESYFGYAVRYKSNPGGDHSHETSSVTYEDLDMPMSYGIGVAYRFSDTLTLSADIYRTEWGDFILTDPKGNKTSPITGLPEGESDVSATHQARVGAEYLLIDPPLVIPLRGGVFYDPAPAQGSPDSFFGVSVGSGIVYERYVLDVAYQYRFGNHVGGSILKDWGFSQNVREHTLYASLIVHF